MKDNIGGPGFQPVLAHPKARGDIFWSFGVSKVLQSSAIYSKIGKIPGGGVSRGRFFLC